MSQRTALRGVSQVTAAHFAPLERTPAAEFAAALVAVAKERVRANSAPLSRLEMVERLDIALDDWQTDALCSTAPRLMLNVTRQGGKSTVAAILGLYEAVYRPRSLVLIVSPAERQSKLLMDKLMAYYRQLAPQNVSSLVENVFSLRLSNGSEIYALPGKEETIRGFSAVNLLLIDEASRVPDALYAAVRPMLAVSGGRLVTMSTPWGKRGWWYQGWSEGGADWERYEIPAPRCPRISDDFLAQERRAMPDLVYQSEYMCEFVEPEDAYFRYESIARAFDASIPTLFPVTEAA